MDEVTAAAGRLAIGLGFWVLVDDLDAELCFGATFTCL